MLLKGRRSETPAASASPENLLANEQKAQISSLVEIPSRNRICNQARRTVRLHWQTSSQTRRTPVTPCCPRRATLWTCQVYPVMSSTSNGRHTRNVHGPDVASSVTTYIIGRVQPVAYAGKRQPMPAPVSVATASALARVARHARYFISAASETHYGSLSWW